MVLATVLPSWENEMPLRLVHIFNRKVHLGPTFPDNLTGDQVLNLTSKYTANLIRFYGNTEGLRVYWMTCDRSSDTPHPANIIDISEVAA